MLLREPPYRTLLDAVVTTLVVIDMTTLLLDSYYRMITAVPAPFRAHTRRLLPAAHACWFLIICRARTKRKTCCAAFSRWFIRHTLAAVKLFSTVKFCAVSSTCHTGSATVITDGYSTRLPVNFFARVQAVTATAAAGAAANSATRTIPPYPRHANPTPDLPPPACIPYLRAALVLPFLPDRFLIPACRTATVSRYGKADYRRFGWFGWLTAIPYMPPACC